MATNYPYGVDSLTNPSSNDDMQTVSHSAQHTNANDAIEAIETELGVSPSGDYDDVTERLDTFANDITTLQGTIPALTKVWVPSGMFNAVVNFPVVITWGAGSQWGAGTWYFDASSPETIGAQLRLPTSWSTMDIDIYTLAIDATAGDVVYKALYDFVEPGDMLNTITVGDAVTFDRGTLYVLQSNTLVSDLAVEDDKIFRLGIRRQADDGSDTLTVDHAVYGVMLRKVT